MITGRVRGIGTYAIDADILRHARRVGRWTTTPESCTQCRRGPARVLRVGRALCETCAAGQRSQAASKRTPAPGLVGLAVPYEHVAKLASGESELVTRAAFASGLLVPVTWGHRGDYVGMARTLSYPTGLYFEVDVDDPERLAGRCAGVSIGADLRRERATRPDGSSLLRAQGGTLHEIALVPAGRTPVYRSTWCAARGPAAWARVNAAQREHFAALVQ